MLKEVYVAACLGLLLVGCVRVRPPASITGVVRDGGGAPIAGTARVWAEQRTIDGENNKDTSAWDTLDRSHATNAMGGFGFALSRTQRDQVRFHPILRIRVKDDTRGIDDTLPVNGYISFYDLRYGPAPASDFKVADMHYHVSMRAQNHFGQSLHDHSRIGAVSRHVPNDINWHHDHTKLLVYDTLKGEWRKAPEVVWSEFEGPGAIDARGRQMLKRRRHYLALLYRDLVRPAGANNRIDQYSQATFPHTRDGHVMLGFNAISPFEQNLNCVPQVRFTSMLIKSGAHLEWLRRLGKQDDDALMTHWENFNYEHGLMAKQDTLAREFPWRFLRDGSQLDSGRSEKPTIVTVIEGGHLFQHELFPNKIDYDIARRTPEQQDALVATWIGKYDDTVKVLGPVSRSLLERRRERMRALDTLEARYRASFIPAKDSARQWEVWDPAKRDRWNASLKAMQRRDILRASLDSTEGAFVDSVLFGELDHNIATLRSPDFFPPVHMVTVAHLSYNGMVGHAPAIDDGGPAGRLIARKVYDIRVSEDPTYLKQWKGIFFAVPGANRFGKHMMRSLLDTTGYGRRILLDLKHSDPSARKYFFDDLMVVKDSSGQPIDTVPPICSHCACTGMSTDLWSSFNDEYSILYAPFTRTFYPFSINLFDEEVITIHRHGGIVGIPLEHRVLGGYIDKRQAWPYRVDKCGTHTGPNYRDKRWNHARWMLQHLDTPADEAHVPSHARALHAAGQRALRRAIQQVVDSLHVDRDDAFDLLKADYVSVEPFLQNLFRLVDLVKRDSLARCPKWHGNVNDRAHPWRHVCIGSDLDGLIDPIDICPTASQYPYLRERMEQLIPVFLVLRKLDSDPAPGPEAPPVWSYAHYFNTTFTVNDALDLVFYESLKEFTRINFRSQRQ